MGGRLAVVGNGIIGLSVAFAAKRLDPSLEVLLYGPDDRSAHHSGSAAAPAMINVFGEVTEELYRSSHGRQLLEIGIAASERWPDFLAAPGEVSPAAATVLHSGTYIVPHASRDGDSRSFAAVRRALADYNVGFEEVELCRVPNQRLAAGLYDPGIYIPSEKFLDARRLLADLDAALSTMPGVRLIRRFARNVESDPPVVVDDSGERQGADVVVLANSFGFNELAAPLGVVGLPHLIRVYGAALRVPYETATPTVVRTPIFGSSCGDYAVYFNGHAYVGATSLAATDRVEITSHLQRSLDFFDPDRNITGCTLVGGIRAMSQDNYPLMGRLAGNMFAAVGFMRSGVTLAPYVSDLSHARRSALPTTMRTASRRCAPFRIPTPRATRLCAPSWRSTAPAFRAPASGAG